MPEDNFEQKIIRIIRKNYVVGNAPGAATKVLEATDQEIENRMRKLGVGITTCKKCGKEIIFIRTKAGNFMPVCLNLISHFADCPGANEFRKRSKITNQLTKKSMENIEDALHDFRKAIDALIQKARKIKDPDNDPGRFDREMALAHTKLQEAKMWVGKCLEKVGSELPKEFKDESPEEEAPEEAPEG